ncbi:MAG: universal stress protein [Bacteroidetes bacterium]|nr:universal stress protein [Bacteroidota bacterium]MBU1719356.1 universal stress protein [Bacteroidota bacterium]
MKPKRILIAVDYDPSARKVAEAGFSFAKAMGADAILLHVISNSILSYTTVYSPVTGFLGYTSVDPSQLENAEGLKMAILHFLDKIVLSIGDKTVRTMVAEGNCAETIIKIAKQRHDDMIVMGSHSRKWLENILMGSVTETVLRQTNIPLFIVPIKKEQ